MVRCTQNSWGSGKRLRQQEDRERGGADLRRQTWTRSSGDAEANRQQDEHREQLTTRLDGTGLRSTMRFIVFALTVLLAGCQARFLQDEPPSQLEHVKSALQVYADQLKQSAHKALHHLDDTEFKDYKEFLTQSIDNIHGYFQHAFQGITPVAAHVLEATAPMREKLRKDVEDLRKQIEPKREELRQVLEKHFQEYSTELKPFVDEYLTKHRQEMEVLKTKMEPVVKNMKEKIATNWEETKSKLMPIVEAVRDKVTHHLQEVKTQLEPYIQEYKEQMEKSALEFRESVRSGKLREKMTALGEQVKPHFEAIVAAVQKAISKE